MVREIQKALHLMPDGIFGSMTEAAVKDFQRSVHLIADGIVGPPTLVKLIPVRLRRSKRVITDIIIHCTASQPCADLSADDIRRMHKAQGWSDIGYHYVVRLDGTVEEGRDVDIIGAHVSGFNKNSIGVVYVGGLDKKQAKKKTLELLESVGVTPAEEKVGKYPHEFSGGMLQRSMIALALACSPKVMIADEATTALDVTMQAKILRLLKSIRDNTNLAVLCITHDLGVVAEICDTVTVMYQGEVVETGSVRDIFDRPKHEYTKKLLESFREVS